MIKNVFIKSILTNTVFKGLSVINQFFPKDDDTILIYGNVGFRDNIKSIYDYLITNNYNRRYKIVVSSNESWNQDIPENVTVVGNLQGVLCFFKAGHVFYAFGKIPIRPSKKQIVVQMWHGTPFKGSDIGVKKAAKSTPCFTYILATSEYFVPVFSREYNCTKDQIMICGQPRTDVMFDTFQPYKELMHYSKRVIWMPTFRKSSVMGYTDTDLHGRVIPILSRDELISLNEVLRKKDILLLIKLHPAQDLADYEQLELSNVILMSHSDFIRKEWDLYKLIAQMDAMITDYSSVFYDYMLLDRPLAFTLDDFEQYNDKRGFAVENPEMLMAGHKIHNLDDLHLFFTDITTGNDPYAEQRRKVCALTHRYTDGENCLRALKIGGVNK